VSAPEKIRVERIISRDKVNMEIIEERMKNQISDEEKCQLSDFVIVNDGKKMLIPQILSIHSTLIKK
jgi:dephospho-CoA kinase